MNSDETLQNILVAYNSIARSRRRWIRNRTLLKNEWKELYQVLETASGRNPGRVLVYDPVWHKVAPKGGARGPVDRQSSEIALLKKPEVKKPEVKAEKVEPKAEVKPEVKKPAPKKTPAPKAEAKAETKKS